MLSLQDDRLEIHTVHIQKLEKQNISDHFHHIISVPHRMCALQDHPDALLSMKECVISRSRSFLSNGFEAHKNGNQKWLVVYYAS